MNATALVLVCLSFFACGIGAAAVYFARILAKAALPMLVDLKAAQLTQALASRPTATVPRKRVLLPADYMAQDNSQNPAPSPIDEVSTNGVWPADVRSRIALVRSLDRKRRVAGDFDD